MKKRRKKKLIKRRKVKRRNNFSINENEKLIYENEKILAYVFPYILVLPLILLFASLDYCISIYNENSEIETKQNPQP